MLNENLLGIQVLADSVPASVMMEIKKATGMALSEIKARVAAGECVYLCHYLDDEGLRTINHLKRFLSAQGSLRYGARLARTSRYNKMLMH